MKIYQLLIMFVLIAVLSTGCMTVSTSGKYTLQNDRMLRGDLIITSGEATLEEDSRVTGNVIMTSGRLYVEGEIDGNILYASTEGINLGPNSVVDGDIIGTSGDVFRADGSWVGGQVSTDDTFTLGAEFFAKAFGFLCGIPVAIGGSIIYLISSRRNQQAIANPHADAAAPRDISGKLMQLKEMQEEGLISAEDYEVKKAAVLADL